MGKAYVFLLVILLAVSSLLTVFPVAAETQTLVVPDQYSTISAALQDASDGDTVFVKKGTYPEQTLQITKSVSLVGEEKNGTVIDFNPPLIEKTLYHNKIMVPDTPIKINANAVSIQSFTLNMSYDKYGLSRGISAWGDGISIIDNSVVNSVYLEGSHGGTSKNSIDGTLEVVGSKQTITNNTINDNLKIHGSSNVISGNVVGHGYYFSGIALSGSSNTVIENICSEVTLEHSDSNILSNNSLARLVVGYNGRNSSDNEITKNRIVGTGNINDGIILSAATNNTLSANIICNCKNGLVLGGNGVTATENSVFLNNFFNNSQHVLCSSGSNYTVNHFDDGVRGNYYDDYTGSDENDDGVGDSPYTNQETRWDETLHQDVTVVIFQDNYPLMAPVDIDSANFNPSVPNGPTDSAAPFPVLTLAIALTIGIVVSVAVVVYFCRRRR
jgi:nitrous oxidase accessory protein